MMAASWIILVVALSVAIFATTRDKRAPLTWSLWLWVLIALVHILRPIPFVPLNGATAAITSVGLVALVLPLLSKKRPAAQEHQGYRRVGLRRYVVLGVTLTALVVIGGLAFRQSISGELGVDYSDLTFQQVRYAQNLSERESSPAALLASLAPVVSCLGLYGAYRFHTMWLSITAIAALVVTQNPSRTATLSLLITTVVFWIYARANITRDDRTGVAQNIPKWRIAIAGALGLGYFVFVGDALSKASTIPGSALPAWADSPVSYMTGGLSALTIATEQHLTPIEHGSSIFLPLRLLNIIDPSTHPPETIGAYVSIPMLFNVYTGFGQVWFDFGFIGLVAMFILLGAVAVFAHRRAEIGRMEWAWTSALIAALLFSLPHGYRLFNVDVALQFVVGLWVFWVIRHSKRPLSPTESRRSRTHLFRP